MRVPERAVINGCQDQQCTLTPATDGFDLVSGDGAVLATHRSARWLSDSALLSGALVVHWNFDLKLAEE